MVISILFISSPLLIWAIKHYSGRLYVKDYDNVHPDAMIVNVSHEKTGWRSSTEIKTIVTFADGVEYHTYRSKSEPGLRYTKLIVDDEVKEIITKKAIIAHKKLAVRLSKSSPQETFTKIEKKTLPEEVLNEFPEYPIDSLAEIFGWISKWQKENPSLNKVSTLEYMKTLASCGNGRTKENGLQTCQNICEEKMRFCSSDVNHMMIQLNTLLDCTDTNIVPNLEDKVLGGLQGFRLSELMRTGKF